MKKNELSEIWRKGESDKPVHLIKVSGCQLCAACKAVASKPKSPVLNVIQPLNKCGRVVK